MELPTWRLGLSISFKAIQTIAEGHAYRTAWARQYSLRSFFQLLGCIRQLELSTQGLS